MAAPVVLCDLMYPDDSKSHGGRHRSVQLQELVEAAGFKAAVIPKAVNQSNGKSYLRGVSNALRHNLPLLGGWKWLRRWGRTVARFEEALAAESNVVGALWENTRPEGWVIPRLAKAVGLPIVAVPQNLEALARGKVINQVSDYPGRELLWEARSMRLADRVYCIASEEQWWLGWYGVKASFLPYALPSSMEERQSTLRARRSGPPAARFLALGSASNPMTYQGMLAIVAMLKEMPAGAPGVDFVGIGTERLKESGLPRGIEAHGRISDEELDAMMARCRGLLVHQPLAVGALTRVAESLAAGIPVLANPIAARSAEHFEGVHVYHDQSELHRLMTDELDVPPIPSRPGQENEFCADLRRCFGSRSGA